MPTEVRCKLEGLRFFLPIFFSRVASSRVVGMSPPADVLISERLSPSCPRVYRYVSSRMLATLSRSSWTLALSLAVFLCREVLALFLFERSNELSSLLSERPYLGLPLYPCAISRDSIDCLEVDLLALSFSLFCITL